jgi:hypothetical protein
MEAVMTCEVAVMNKRGIALAADSAVTLGNGKKIYHTAEKLFSLSPSIPVAIMTFGATDMMNVPWETVVKIYVQKLGSRRFDTLDQCAKDFLSFIEGATSLFPPEDQKSHVKGVVGAAWSELYRDKLSEKLGKKSKVPENDKLASLTEIIHNDHELWMKYEDIEGLGPDYGARVVKTYGDVLDQVEKQVFEGMKLPRTLKSDLRKTVSLMYGKEWFHPSDESGVVIAGMGESEPFPALFQYRVGTVAAGKLRCAKVDEARVGTADAVVVPFAQRETIDMIIGGIHPRLRSKLIDDINRWLPNGGKNGKAKNPERIEKRKKEFADYMRDEIQQRYDQPFMDSVSALPRQDLAKMAEALVNLTAFLMRMTADQDETVAEPIDVALLSKGDGFIWIKHKEFGRRVGMPAL